MDSSAVSHMGYLYYYLKVRNILSIHYNTEYVVVKNIYNLLRMKNNERVLVIVAKFYNSWELVKICKVMALAQIRYKFAEWV